MSFILRKYENYCSFIVSYNPDRVENCYLPVLRDLIASRPTPGNYDLELSIFFERVGQCNRVAIVHNDIYQSV